MKFNNGIRGGITNKGSGLPPAWTLEEAAVFLKADVEHLRSLFHRKAHDPPAPTMECSGNISRGRIYRYNSRQIKVWWATLPPELRVPN